MMSRKSILRKTLLSMLISDSQFNFSWSKVVLRRFFYIILRLEKDLSPLQFETIILRYMRSMISMLGNTDFKSFVAIIVYIHCSILPCSGFLSSPRSAMSGKTDSVHHQECPRCQMSRCQPSSLQLFSILQ
jgi:hypothetical protein